MPLAPLQALASLSVLCVSVSLWLIFKSDQKPSKHHLRLNAELVARRPAVLVLQAAEVALDLERVLAQEVIHRGAGLDDVVVGGAGGVEPRVAGGGLEAVADEEVAGLGVPAVGAEGRPRLRAAVPPEVLRERREAAQLEDHVAAEDGRGEVVHARARAVQVVALRLQAYRQERATGALEVALGVTHGSEGLVDDAPVVLEGLVVVAEAAGRIAVEHAGR